MYDNQPLSNRDSDWKEDWLTDWLVELNTSLLNPCYKVAAIHHHHHLTRFNRCKRSRQKSNFWTHFTKKSLPNPKYMGDRDKDGHNKSPENPDFWVHFLEKGMISARRTSGCASWNAVYYWKNVSTKSLFEVGSGAKGRDERLCAELETPDWLLAQNEILEDFWLLQTHVEKASNVQNRNI